MPKCIVCRADYTPGKPCPRCKSDNSAWDEWRREETDAPWPLLRFLEPHLFLPLLIAGWALIFGLMGILWPWGGVRTPVVVLAVVFTFVGCILATATVYQSRFALREQELLRRVRRGWRKGLGIDMQISLVPAVFLVLAMAFTMSLMQSEMVWNLMEWLVLEPDTSSIESSPPSEEHSHLQERIRRAFPLMCLSGYVTLAAFSYSSSLMLAQEYARRLNEQVPQPIFLREEMLTKIVKRQAKRILSRPSTPPTDGGGETATETEQAPERWTWEEMERTRGGGIRLIARVEREDSRVEESVTGHRVRHPQFIGYTIEANPWGRITKIKRDTEETQY